MHDEQGSFPTVRNAFFIVVVTLLLSILVEAFWGGSQSKWRVLLLETLTLVPVLVLVFVRRFSFREVFKWRAVDGRLLFLSGFIGLGMSIVTDEMDRMIQMLIPMPEKIQQAMHELMRIGSTEDLVVLVIATVVVAGFAEEMLFRGFFQGTLEHVTDVTKAVLSTAFVFAFVHFNPWWIVEILLLGVLLGVLVWRSGSVFPAVVVHGVYNGIALYLMNCDASRLDWYLVKGHVSPVWIVLGLGVIVWGFRLFYRLAEPGEIFDRRNGQEGEERL